MAKERSQKMTVITNALLFLLLILPFGLIGGSVGIYLRKKYTGHKYENFIVLGGMGITVAVTLALFFWYML